MVLKSKYTLSVLLFSLGACVPTYADELIQEYTSARLLGRGNAGMAMIDGADAVFYNPAGMAQGKDTLKEVVVLSPQVEGSTNLKQLYNNRNGSLSDVVNMIVEHENDAFYGRGQNYTGIVFDKVALGSMQQIELLATVYTEPISSIPGVPSDVPVSEIPIADLTQYLPGLTEAQIEQYLASGVPGVDLYLVSRVGAYLSLAHGFFNDRLLLGVTGKFVQKKEVKLNVSVADIETTYAGESFQTVLNNAEKKGNGLGLDVGSMLILDADSKTQFGFVCKNIGMDYRMGVAADSNAPSAEPVLFNAAFSTSVGTNKNRFYFVADYDDVFNEQQTNVLKRTHAGVEYNLLNTLFVSGGLNQGYLTYGGGASFKVVRIEGGYYAEEVGTQADTIKNGRYFGRLSLGWLL